MPEKAVQWIRFFTMQDTAELETLCEQNPAIVEASDMLRYISQDPKEREYFESRRKAMLDEHDRLLWAKAQGEAEGEARGRVEGEAKG